MTCTALKRETREHSRVFIKTAGDSAFTHRPNRQTFAGSYFPHPLSRCRVWVTALDRCPAGRVPPLIFASARRNAASLRCATPAMRPDSLPPPLLRPTESLPPRLDCLHYPQWPDALVERPR